MSGLLQYRPLFSVEMLHDYYLSEESDLFNQDAILRREVLALQGRRYQLSRDLIISPTPDCVRTLRNKRLIFKQNNRGFFVAAQVSAIDGAPNGPFTPFIPLDESFRLRFAVTMKNPYFNNITNLRMEKDFKQRDRFLYHFSNRTVNIVNHPTDGDLLYISATVPPFNPDYTYEAGEIIMDGAGMFEAREDNGPNPVRNNSQWTEIYQGQNPHFQFVTASDRLVLRPGVFRHTVANEIQAFTSVVITISDRANTLLDTFKFTAQDPQNPAATLESCPLELGHLAPDVYRLDVQLPNGTAVPEFGLTFYLDDVLYRQGPLALIECFHEPDDSLGDYRWMDETDQNRLLQPVYRMRWKNRSSWWRYYYTESPPFTPAGSDVGHLDADPANPNHHILITPAPVALTQVARSIKIVLNAGDQLLPNPGVEAIFPENGMVFSEVNMGGGLGPPA